MESKKLYSVAKILNTQTIREMVSEINKRRIEKNNIVFLSKEGEQYILVYYE